MKTLLSLLCVLTMADIGPAQELPKRKVRVQLEVSGKDGLDNTITGFFSRALRKIPDVTIVDANPDFRLSIVAVALTIHNQASDHARGYALSVVVTSLSERFLVLFIAEKTQTPEQQKFLNEVLSRGVLHQHLVQIAPVDALEEVCDQIVAEVDGQEFESQRKFTDGLIESLKQQ